MIIEHKYNIGDVVEIIQIEVEAVITEIKWDGLYVSYLLEYWVGGDLKTVWQWENQIKGRKMDNSYKLHDVTLPPDYMPIPGQHLNNPRDCEHYLNSLTIMMENDYHSILDIGCYDGWHPILLARDEYEVTGIEFIHSLVEAARRYAGVCDIKNVQFLESGWLTAQPPKMQYDLITAYEVLEHVPLGTVDEWIAKMERYGKTISISLPNQKHEENPQHQWTPTKELIDELFKGKNGLTIRYQEYPLTPTVPGNWFITYES